MSPLLRIITVIMSPLLRIITRSIIRNNEFIITYYRPGQLGDGEAGDVWEVGQRRGVSGQEKWILGAPIRDSGFATHLVPRTGAGGLGMHMEAGPLASALDQP